MIVYRFRYLFLLFYLLWFFFSIFFLFICVILVLMLNLSSVISHLSAKQWTTDKRPTFSGFIDVIIDFFFFVVLVGSCNWVACSHPRCTSSCANRRRTRARGSCPSIGRPLTPCPHRRPSPSTRCSINTNNSSSSGNGRGPSPVTTDLSSKMRNATIRIERHLYPVRTRFFSTELLCKLAISIVN